MNDDPVVYSVQIHHPSRRNRKAGTGAPAKERMRQTRSRRRDERVRQVGVIDFETDPFDNTKPKEEIQPFAACIYADDLEPIIIWEDDVHTFYRALLAKLKAIPGRYTWYAHNGGRFDFMFLVHLLRGDVSFKGRAIMLAKIGEHELRDSYHIIPEKLAAIQKDNFDYAMLKRSNRHRHRAEIIRYMTNDCRYLLDAVKSFLLKFGFRLSIGQAAMYELKKFYTVKKFSERWDEYIRNYFYGGRVECLAGRGRWQSSERTYKLYDVNSMYPAVMANCQHPIGGFHDYNLRGGEPGPDTVFVKLACKNHGALISRNENNETTANIPEGEFKTTIWEYEVARRYNLIRDVSIIYCVDCSQRTNFADFVLPLYTNRLNTKSHLKYLAGAGLTGSPEWIETLKDDVFYKLLLNNAYGKFAQNPRNFKDHYLTDPDDKPPSEWFPRKGAPSAKGKSNAEIIGKELQYLHFEGDTYWIWQKPAPTFRYNNVGTAASITGAARAVLLEALQRATDPIYCDTDSIIATDLHADDTFLSIDNSKLGAWKIEQEFDEVVINGKKQYGCVIAGSGKAIKIRQKGAQNLTWEHVETMLAGGSVSIRNTAPTITKYKKQYYVTRSLQATAPFGNGLLRQHLLGELQ